MLAAGVCYNKDHEYVHAVTEAESKVPSPINANDGSIDGAAVVAAASCAREMPSSTLRLRERTMERVYMVISQGGF